MLLAEEGKSLEVITAAQEVFDVSGAGDTFAALALFSAGTPFIESARFANLAAGIVVGKVGTATVSRNSFRGKEMNKAVFLDRDAP